MMVSVWVLHWLPTSANFFLAHIENKLLLGKQLDFHPKLYSKYVDDIFAVYDNSDHCIKFLDLLNSQHNNIKFTVELPSDAIPFLDVKIRFNETGIDTWVHRKPTNTNLLLNMKQELILGYTENLQTLIYF